ncbi:hypothetical protein ACE6H2_023199 [Prunus campanulata]
MPTRVTHAWGSPSVITQNVSNPQRRFNFPNTAALATFKHNSTGERQAHIAEFSLTSRAERLSDQSIHNAVSFPSSLIRALGGLHATIGNNETIESESECRRQIQVPNREASQSVTWGTTVCTISDPPLIH